jgi:heterotetrameric sarcosine oxidase gamma subunit
LTLETPVSAPDVTPGAVPAAGIAIGLCRADVVELAVVRDRAQAIQLSAASGAITLPSTGHAVAAADALVLCVRPERWLLITAAAPAGASAARWQQLFAGTAAAIDQSSGLTALHIAGPSAREVLARGCRLDLDPTVFPPGHAAATVMAQVATILAALPSGLLILTPASTARHFREWLAAAARPFGLATPADVTVSTLSGHHDS